VELIWVVQITDDFDTTKRVMRQYFFFESAWTGDGYDFIYSILIFFIGTSRIGIRHWLHTLWATLPAQNAVMPDFP
jgi:hypothetical protein